jgi:hypothetical protein
MRRGLGAIVTAGIAALVLSGCAIGGGDLSIGEVADLDGLKVGVQEVVYGTYSDNGEQYVEITVSYQNDTDEEVSVKSQSWSLENPSGLRSDAYATDTHNSTVPLAATLAPGGSTSGGVVIQFGDSVAKVVFDGAPSGESQSWVVESDE